MTGGVQIYSRADARAMEAALLSAVTADGPPRSGDASSLQQPIRILVPSHSLRLHLNSVLVAPPQRARVGVRVQTLSEVAAEILSSQESRLPAEPYFSLLVERALAENPRQWRRLSQRPDLAGTVAPGIADLLDAGFESDALGACLGKLDPRNDATSIELLHLANHTRSLLDEYGLARAADSLSRAAQRLRKTRGAALKARRILVYGFAEATGRASDLIEALLEHCAATILIQRPASPTFGQHEDAGCGFSDRLVRRLSSFPIERSRVDPQTRRLQGQSASDPETEFRSVAETIAGLLEQGQPAETIGVVARNLEGLAQPLARQFERRGVPFSSLAAAPRPTAAQHRVHSLLQLIRDAGRSSVALWLEIDRRELPSSSRRDLATACHALGCPQLDALAALDPAERLGEQKSLGLPVRRGFTRTGLESERVVAQRRSVALEALQESVEQASRVVSALDSWPEAGSVGELARATEELASSILHWSEGDDARALLAAASRQLSAGAPPDLKIDADDFGTLLQAQIRTTGEHLLGGAGAGVRVLDVTQARALSFEHLFVVGLNRDAFPRSYSEDPLFRDSSREKMSECLPELPLKLSASAEESYLFAQLIGASPNVYLSWHQLSSDGRARSRSPFVDRLTASDTPLSVSVAVPAYARTFSGRRSALESAVAAGLAGNSAAYSDSLEAALRLRQPAQAASLRRARLRIHREFEPSHRERARLSPYFGIIGAKAQDPDPRDAPLFVTTIESYLRCPWQTFLKRYLRIEGTPDALDSLPSLSDPALVGTTVHRALEMILSAGLSDSPALVSRSDRFAGIPLRWPPAGQIEPILLEVAHAALLESGVESRGMARALAQVTRPYVDRARELLMREPSILLATEIEGRIETSEGSVAFRADLAERRPDGVRLTDFKTGRSFAPLATPEGRAQKFLSEIRSGRALQAGVYSLASAEGRYLFLRPDLPDDHADLGVRSEQDGVRESLSSLALGLTGLRNGVFFPRLEAPDGNEPAACSWCDVADACLRSDSGARSRLVQIASSNDPALTPLFYLGSESS